MEVENTVHHFYREVFPVYLVADGCHFLTFSYRQLSYMLAFNFYKCSTNYDIVFTHAGMPACISVVQLKNRTMS